jgi:hypothetical protein
LKKASFTTKTAKAMTKTFIFPENQFNAKNETKKHTEGLSDEQKRLNTSVDGQHCHQKVMEHPTIRVMVITWSNDFKIYFRNIIL